MLSIQPFVSGLATLYEYTSTCCQALPLPALLSLSLINPFGCVRLACFTLPHNLFIIARHCHFTIIFGLVFFVCTALMALPKHQAIVAMIMLMFMIMTNDLDLHSIFVFTLLNMSAVQPVPVADCRAAY